MLLSPSEERVAVREPAQAFPESLARLDLLNPAAGATTGAPLDLGMSTDSKFLYVREGTGTLAGFQVEQDGSLTPIVSVTGLPAGAQGIAIR